MLMTVRGTLVQNLILPDRHWPYFLVTLLAMVLAAGLGYTYGKYLGQRGITVATVFQGARGWVFLVSFMALCGLMQVITAKPDLWSPEVSSRVELWGWGIIKLLVVVIGAMAFPLSKPRAQRHPLLIAGISLVCVLAVQTAENYIFVPVFTQLKEPRRGADGSILQSSNVTCTPSSLANLLPIFGLASNEKECARLLGTKRFGTTVTELISGARKFGLYGYYVSSSPDHLRRMNRPAVLTVIPKWIKVLHSIALYKNLPDGKFLIIDPLQGQGKYTAQQLSQLLADKKAVIFCDRPLVRIDQESPGYLVERVQRILQQEKYLAGITGAFDEPTIQAVKAFQTHWQIYASGDMDDLTYLLLTGPYLDAHHL